MHLFGGSLRLIDVRSILRLTSARCRKRIRLPDIDRIELRFAFANGAKEADAWLFSNTFEEEERSLLVILYLAGYHQRDFSILHRSVADFDVPINVGDANGDSLLHHMACLGDYDR